MAQLAPVQPSAQQPEPRHQPNPWLAQIPFVLLWLWLVFKQRYALADMHVAPGPYNRFAVAASVLVFLPWVRVLKGRWQMACLLVLDLIITFVIYADLLYFRQFGDLVSVASARFALQLSDVGGAVTALMRPQDLALWWDIPVLAALFFVPQRFLARTLAPLKKRTAAVLMALGLVALGTFYVADPYMQAKYYGHTMYASRLGLMNYHAVDIGNYAQRLTLRLAPKGPAVAEVNGYFAAKRAATPPPASPLAGIAKGKNVIVIQVESLQNFTIGLKVNGQEVTPNLNRLVGRSLYFNDFFTQIGQGVTSDADLLGNCSLLPTRTGAVYYDFASGDYRCNPTVLREHGYHAFAAQGMPADFWNLATMYPKVGFEHFYSASEYDLSDKLGIGLSDQSFFRQSLTRLGTLPQPYYTFLVTLTSHGPFDFPGIPHDLPLGNLQNTVAGYYLDAVHYTDKAIGDFIDGLEKQGLLDKSVVVIYGDHGGVFRGGSGMTDLLGIPQTDIVHWIPVEKRVPLIIHLPGDAGAGVHPEAAGEADIAPTLDALLGVPTSDTFFMGRNLLEQPAGPVAFYDDSAANTHYLYLLTAEGGGACMDRSTGAQVDMAQCGDLGPKAQEQLRISRDIIERNLIPYLKR